MEQKSLAVFLLVAVLPAVLTASADRLGSVHLDSRLKRESSGEGNGFSGKYVSLQGDGIHFHSKNGYLSVTTLDDQPVFFASMDPLMGEEGFGYMSIRGKPFAFVNDQAYALSEHMSIQTLLSHGQREQFIAQLQEDNEYDDDTATETSMDELAQTREAVLMEETALVLGTKHSVIGSENPDVLPLYMMAMELSSIRKETTATTTAVCNKDYKCPRNGCNVESFSGDKYCKSASQGDCPSCEPDECYGMCGYGCCCWEFVCDDCCYHELCARHDTCCRKRSSWKIWKNDCANVDKMIRRRLRGGCEGNYKC